MSPRQLVASWLVFCGLSLSGVAAFAAAPAPLPAGHWEDVPGAEPRICLDILPQGRLRLTVTARLHDRPVVAEGPYQVLSRSGSPIKLKLTVDRLLTKKVARCRSGWIHQKLPYYEVAALQLTVGQLIELSVEVGCAANRSSAQLCLRKEGRDVLCRKLSSRMERPDCQPEPPLSLEQVLPVGSPQL